MPIYDFDMINEQFISIDKLPDNRTDAEKLFSPLSIYNHDSPDIAYAERLAEEIVNISGGVVTLFVRSDNYNSNGVWEEDSTPVYNSGIRLKGFFTQQPMQTELTSWGVDRPNKTKVIFPRSIIIKNFGSRMLRSGDLIEIPYNVLISMTHPTLSTDKNNTLNKFRIIGANDSGSFKYRYLYYTCMCENITADTSIQLEHK